MSHQTKNPPRVNTLPVALEFLKRFPDAHIFPIQPLAKFPPKTKDNLDTGASNDRQVIAAWHDQWPGCNWGLALAKSKIVVVDIDRKPGKNGDATIADLELKHSDGVSPAFPETLTIGTPSTGLHKYYDGEHRFALGKHGFGEDVDSPNYVLLPGCVTKDGRYSIVNDVTMAEAPAWFYEVLDANNAEAQEQTPVVDLNQDPNIKWAIHYASKDAKPSIQGQGGEKTLLDVAGVLKDAGISEHVAVDLLFEHYNPRCIPMWGGPDAPVADQLAVKVHNAYTYLRENAPGSKTAAAIFADNPLPPLTSEQQQEQERIGEQNARTKPLDGPKRRQVRIVPGQLVKAMDQVQRIVGPQTDRRDPVFKRNDRLVHLSRNLTDDGVKLKHFEKDALVIRDASKHWLATRLEKSVEFVAPNGKDKDTDKVIWSPINAPLTMIDRILGDSTNWLGYPTLHSTTEAPTLRADGTILDKPGYDPATGLFYDPGDVRFPPIKNNPTIEQGKIAINLIADLLADFPFPDEVSRAVAMSLLLSSIVRRTMDTAPVYFIDGDDAEAGKTTLGKIGGALATGRDIEVQAYAASVEERDKLLPALLLSASPYLLFDNVPDGCIVEGAEMEKVITSPTYQSRPFGKNDVVRTMPTNATMVFTGIKMSAQGAMTTRALVIRIVPDKPLAERTFKHPDIVAYVIKSRPLLVAAILTALRAFLVHGKPHERDRDRFPQWSKLIRSALIWYGYDDPQRGGDRLRADDPIKEAQREVIRAWWRKFDDESVMARDLASAQETRVAIAEGLGIQERGVNGITASRYIDKLAGVRLDLPVDIKKAAKVSGMAQQYRLELKPSARPNWAHDGEPSDDDPSGLDDDFEMFRRDTLEAELPSAL